MTLGWADNSVTETGFRIYRANAPTGAGSITPSWTAIADVIADATSYVDGTVQPGALYLYYVVAINAAVPMTEPRGKAGDDHSSDAASAAIPEKAPFTSASPTISVGTRTLNEITVNLSWTGPGEVRFNLFRAPAGTTNYVLVNSDLIESGSFTDKHLPSGTSFIYKAVALNSESAPSAASTVTTCTLTPTVHEPDVRITSPAAFAGINLTFGDRSLPDDNRIRSFTVVQGIVDDQAGANISGWQLTLTPIGTNASVVISSNASTNKMHVGSIVAGTSGTLGAIDPSRFAPGNYTLKLSVSYGNNQTTSTDKLVSLASDAKLGSLTLPMTDMTVNTPGGQPITVERTYDSSLASQDDSRIGYGWKLNWNQVVITSTADVSTGSPTWQMGDVLYVTLPSGEQHAFQFLPTQSSYRAGLNPNPYYHYDEATYYVQFVCVDGSGATLKVPGDIRSNEPEPFHYHVDDKMLYGESAYRLDGTWTLSTANGSTYTINGDNAKLTEAVSTTGQVTHYTITRSSRRASVHIAASIRRRGRCG